MLGLTRTWAVYFSPSLEPWNSLFHIYLYFLSKHWNKILLNWQSEVLWLRFWETEETKKKLKQLKLTREFMEQPKIKFIFKKLPPLLEVLIYTNGYAI